MWLLPVDLSPFAEQLHRQTTHTLASPCTHNQSDNPPKIEPNDSARPLRTEPFSRMRLSFRIVSLVIGLWAHTHSCVGNSTDNKSKSISSISAVRSRRRPRPDATPTPLNVAANLYIPACTGRLACTPRRSSSVGHRSSIISPGTHSLQCAR